ncbi:hypothetical protein [Streptomyces sp. AK02-01A]|nr:hypothetical protein [Streptomyces sp. AK02-01A]MDX3854860.1 hypothetical protein [Streptomyces sp. AK02-01A]
MPDFLTPVLTKVALVAIESIVSLLLTRLWTDYARSRRAATAPAFA